MVVKIWLFNNKKHPKVLSNNEEVIFSQLSKIKKKFYYLDHVLGLQ